METKQGTFFEIINHGQMAWYEESPPEGADYVR
jgi:hypothetical protein